MILINMLDMTYPDYSYSRIVHKGSKAHELAEELSQSIIDLSSNETAEFKNLESLLSILDNRDSYPENNLPCTIEEVYTVLYQYYYY